MRRWMALIPCGALVLFLRYLESLVFRACGQKVRVRQDAWWHRVRLVIADNVNTVHLSKIEIAVYTRIWWIAFPAKAPNSG